MPNSRAILFVDVLILITLLAAAGVAGTVVLTAADTIPTLDIGFPTASTSGGVTNIGVPFTLSDQGPLAISDLSIQLVVTDAANNTVAQGNFGPLSIQSGQVRKGVVSLPLDLSAIPPGVLDSLMTKSQNLTVEAYVSTSVQPFVALSGSAAEVVTWGALVGNLKLGTPSVGLFNSSALAISLPLQFQNGNPFIELSGAASVQVLDSDGVARGSGTTNFDVPPNSVFKWNETLIVGIPSSASQLLIFNDSKIGYSAVTQVSVDGGSYSTTLPLTIDWGAPISSLSVGALSATAYNSTYSRFSIPLSFVDRSAFLTLNDSASAIVLDPTGLLAGVATPLTLNVQAGRPFSGTLIGFVKTSYLSSGKLVLALTFTTPLGIGVWQEVVGVA